LMARRFFNSWVDAVIVGFACVVFFFSPSFALVIAVEVTVKLFHRLIWTKRILLVLPYHEAIHGVDGRVLRASLRGFENGARLD
jgi:hypothetical protein